MTTTFDFGDGNGPVLAHRHINPDGGEGGWVADTARVDATVYVSPEARVGGNARIEDNVHIEDSACVVGNARHMNNAYVRGEAWVGGNRRILINPLDPPNKQQFSISHELGHAQMQHGSSRRDGKRQCTQDNYVLKEFESIEFAGELLMPRKAVKVMIEQRNLDFDALCEKFGVSVEAMSLRGLKVSPQSLVRCSPQ